MLTLIATIHILQLAYIVNVKYSLVFENFKFNINSVRRHIEWISYDVHPSRYNIKYRNNYTVISNYTITQNAVTLVMLYINFYSIFVIPHKI